VIEGEKISKNEIGELGEKIAAKFLQRKGWKLLYRNFHAPGGGEVDLIMRGGDELMELVFIEVKTRTYRGYGRPLDAVNQEKQYLIERGAREWLRLLSKGKRKSEIDDPRRKIAWRFDVVEVILRDGETPSVNLVENAF